MNKKQRKRIVDRHRDSLTRYGYDSHALYWSSREIQELRFKVLADIGIKSGDSVLDVGCGFADFKHWMGKRHEPTIYTGLDLSPDLLNTAKEMDPEIQLYCGELNDFSFEMQSFDWVILSGGLNEDMQDDGAYVRSMISHMYDLSRKGLAFNLLNKRDKNIRLAFGLQSFDPDGIVDYCQSLCPDVKLIDDYLNNDFTIHMFRV